MKKLLKRFLLGISLVMITGLLAMCILFRKEIGTLRSLMKVDDYPLYTMSYMGDYGFSDFLLKGASSDRDIEKYIVKRLLKGVDIDLGISSAGCSAFTAQNQDGQRLFARNFDYDYAPVLLLKTSPSDGYASVSVINLAFAGYGEESLPDSGVFDCFLTLACPYLPFDGMNEKGLAIALLAVPHAEPPNQEGRIMLNTTTVIRLILDHAASVDEAAALLGDYNLYFSGGVECHYLISDAEGNSAVMEFLDEDIKFIKTEKKYQLTTNFIMYQGLNEGEGGSEFERYQIIDETLSASGGSISAKSAMELLSAASIPGRTQWSVVYNQSTSEIWICSGEKYDHIYSFSMETMP